MLNLHGSEGGPWIKSDLNTGGISVDRIKGLYRAEEHSRDETKERFDRETKERYSHDEVYGKWWNVNNFIDVPVDYALAYGANVYSLEEWTHGIRNLKHVGNGIYEGKDLSAPHTEIFVKSEPHHDARAVDYHFAWDQREELWIRHYLRFIDSKPALNRPGTILSWLSCKHPYYDRKSPNQPGFVKDAQSKKGREWIGDHWRQSYAWHKIEADNLRYILEHRYHNRK